MGIDIILTGTSVHLCLSRSMRILKLSLCIYLFIYLLTNFAFHRSPRVEYHIDTGIVKNA
jgi:hypothetical protein